MGKPRKKVTPIDYVETKLDDTDSETDDESVCSEFPIDVKSECSSPEPYSEQIFVEELRIIPPSPSPEPPRKRAKYVTKPKLGINDPRPCKYCEKTFPNRTTYYAHLEKQHPNERKRRFRCEACDINFPRNAALQKHLKIHKEDKPFKCEICHKHYGSPQLVKNHMRIHKERERFQCTQCPKSFTERNSLKGHEKRHTGYRPFQCEVCGKAFYLQSQVGRHMVVHNKPEKTIACEECGKMCVDKWSLQVHKRSHSGIRNHVCNLCDKSFFSQSHLRLHMHIHTGERPYSCSICNLTFKQRAHVKVHVRLIHEGEHKYQCEVCSVGFTKKAAFLKHKRMHDDIKCHTCNECFADLDTLATHKCTNFKCDICIKSFTSLENLEKHKQRHAEPASARKAFICMFCPKEFERRGIFEIHIQKNHPGVMPVEELQAIIEQMEEKRLKAKKPPETAKVLDVITIPKPRPVPTTYQNRPIDERTVECPTCGKLYASKYTLQAHERIHLGQRPYRCDVCSKSFVHSSHLKAHILIHTGEKPFKCEFCDRSFTQVGAIRRHHKVAHEPNLDTKFKCSYCPKEFKVKEYLFVHESMHRAGKKPQKPGKRFKCNVCVRSFHVRSKLRAHQCTPYKCTTCGKMFTSQELVDEHVVSHVGRDFQCSWCTKDFTRKCDMLRHISIVHGSKVNPNGEQLPSTNIEQHPTEEQNSLNNEDSQYKEPKDLFTEEPKSLFSEEQSQPFNLEEPKQYIDPNVGKIDLQQMGQYPQSFNQTYPAAGIFNPQYPPYFGHFPPGFQPYAL